MRPKGLTSSAMCFSFLLIKGMPFFDPYRADPHFQALLAKMNLA